MARKRDESRVADAARLAASGKTQAEVAAEVGVTTRQLRRWGIEWPIGRPQVPQGQASARTARRRKARDSGKTA
jgi:transposase-like protein